MSTSSSSILKAGSASLGRVMELGRDLARPWRPEELAAVFQHQMAAPVSVDLASLAPGAPGKLKTLTDASGLLLKSFRDLFRHPQPPLELLQLVKEFAKRNRGHPESLLPSEVATLLYYLALAAALVRWGERITSLRDAELERGLDWAIAQDWIDVGARGLLTEARTRLGAPEVPQIGG